MDTRVIQELPKTGVIRRRRPFGVGVIAVLMVINAVASTLTLYFDYDPNMAEFRAGGVLEVSSLSVSALGLAVAVGLWFLKRWAWAAVMAVLGFDMALDIYSYFNDTPVYFSMLLSVIAVFYMNQRDVRQAFGYTPLGDADAFE